MSSWIEERAASLREQSGGETGRLIEILAPRVQVRWTAGLALCVHLPGGRAVIYCPPEDEELIHEVGHAEGTAGLGPELERQGCPWARLQIWREEAIAERFAETFDSEEV